MIWFLIIWSINCVGLFALSASMSKHQKQIFGRELTQKQNRWLSLAGWLILVCALMLCMRQGHLSNQISYWLGVLTLSALFCGLCLSYQAHHFKRILLTIILSANAGLILYLF